MSYREHDFKGWSGIFQLFKVGVVGVVGEELPRRVNHMSSRTRDNRMVFRRTRKQFGSTGV
jgi:hypothetical protein